VLVPQGRNFALDASRFVPSVEDLAMATHTCCAALRNVGLRRLAAGVLSAIGAPLSQVQDWSGTTPTPAASPAASSDGPIAGLTGGLPVRG
jgi:hypothetical protein